MFKNIKLTSLLGVVDGNRVFERWRATPKEERSQVIYEAISRGEPRTITPPGMEGSGVLTRQERLAEAATPPQASTSPTRALDLSTRTDYRPGGGHYNHTTHDFTFLYEHLRDFAEFEAEVNQHMAGAAQLFEGLVDNPLISAAFAMWAYGMYSGAVKGVTGGEPAPREPDKPTPEQARAEEQAKLLSQVEASQSRMQVEMVEICKQLEELQRQTSKQLEELRGQISELLHRSTLPPPPRPTSVYTLSIDPITGLVRMKPLVLPPAAQPPSPSITPQEAVEAVMKAQEQASAATPIPDIEPTAATPPAAAVVEAASPAAPAQPSVPVTHTWPGYTPVPTSSRGALMKFIFKLLTRGR